MNPQQENILFQAIGKIEGKVDAINQRLDVSNGRTGKNEARIERLEKRADRQDGAIRYFNWIWATILSLIGLVFGALVFFKR